MAEQIFSFNGVDGTTGEYLLPGLTAEEVSRIARGEPLEKEHLCELRHRYKTRNVAHLGVREGIDPTVISDAGWGVIFAHADGIEVEKMKEALKPLLELRKEQAGKRYREYIGVNAYRPGESKTEFLARHGIGPGPADPNVVPYYLLIVAAPESIPYTFQYQLDVTYAVGRIHFDRSEDYNHYANAVVASEVGQNYRKKLIQLFGVQNTHDKATNISSKELIQPLSDDLQKSNEKWEIRACTGEKTYKSDLIEILNSNRPAFLFSASHGMGFPKDDPLLLRHQGALLCQDWPGPLGGIGQPVPPDQYFSADDLADVQVDGMVAFCFACYGAGTPRLDQFAHETRTEREEIAPKPFVARLPQQMLCHPKGGALAFVGHVERAWGYSFVWPGAGTQRAVFEDSIARLLNGHPIGSALEYFDDKYAEISTVLSDHLEDIKYGKTPNHLELARMWTANNDAKSYVIVGDPAVRLNVANE